MVCRRGHRTTLGSAFRGSAHGSTMSGNGLAQPDSRAAAAGAPATRRPAQGSTISTTTGGDHGCTGTEATGLGESATRPGDCACVAAFGPTAATVSNGEGGARETWPAQGSTRMPCCATAAPAMNAAPARTKTPSCRRTTFPSSTRISGRGRSADGSPELQFLKLSRQFELQAIDLGFRPRMRRRDRWAAGFAAEDPTARRD
jgi:hypothetical protein